MKTRNKPTRTKIKTKSIKIKNKPKAKLPKATKVKPAKLKTKAKPIKIHKSKPLTSQLNARTKETYPHFRKYKRSGHPALIVSEHSDTEYKYRKVMHSDKDGDRINEKVTPNPCTTDKEPMYIGKRSRHDKKNKFDERLSWVYPEKK